MCKFAIMKTSRIYHELNLDIVSNESGEVCYVLLPDKLKDTEMDWLEEMSLRHSMNIVVISGMKWNEVLTPWQAPGLSSKEEDFKGKARYFLDALIGDVFVNTEQSLRLNNPGRHLVGVSLAGLFALWATAHTDRLDSAASVSGSLWYDGFSEWLKGQELRCGRYFISLGEKEVKSKNERISSVGTLTQEVVQCLKDKGLDVVFSTDEGNHFDHLRERLEKAFAFIVGNQY